MTALFEIRSGGFACGLLLAGLCLQAGQAPAQPLPEPPRPLGNSVLDDDDRPQARASDLDEAEQDDSLQPVPPPPRLSPSQPPSQLPQPSAQDPQTLPELQQAPPTDLSADDFTNLSDFDDAALDEPPGLAGIPDMFGDTFLGTPTLFYSTLNPVGPAIETAIVDLPLAAGSYRSKISEHNRALPTDRVYVNYNYFDRALNTIVQGREADDDHQFARNRAPLDRFTIGLEKTLFCGGASLEVRLPFAGRHQSDFADPYAPPAGDLFVRGDEVGNVSVILKQLLYVDQFAAYSWGIGLEAPTGDDATAFVDNLSFHISNDAIHISPYVAVLSSPGTSWFFSGFAALEIPTNGHRVFVRDEVTFDRARLGIWNDQTLLHLDGSVGWWLFQNPCAPICTGLAPLVELHYSTNRLQSLDVVKGKLKSYTVPASQADFFVTHGAGQFDLLSLTLAMHAQLGCHTQLRVGWVAPLLDGNDRLFRNEITAQLSHYF